MAKLCGQQRAGFVPVLSFARVIFFCVSTSCLLLHPYVSPSPQPIILKLLDIEVMKGALEGVVMELEDCSFPLLVGMCRGGRAIITVSKSSLLTFLHSRMTLDIVPTLDPNVAFADCDVAILVGAIPRRDGMERKDLLTANAKIFKTQGQIIDKMAKKSVKVSQFSLVTLSALLCSPWNAAVDLCSLLYLSPSSGADCRQSGQHQRPNHLALCAQHLPLTVHLSDPA